MSNFYAVDAADGGGGGGFTPGDLTDVGTDGIVITGGTGAVNGAGTQIAQHVADASHNGYLSSADWTTFNAKQAALTIGNLTDAGTDGITVTGGTGAVIGSGTSLSQHVADASHNGYLSSTDWTAFNAKQATVTIGALDAQAENANGLALVAGVLSTQSADATHPGVVNNTTQTLGGNKTFIRGAAISGTSDEVQLTIQGNSSQSNRLVQFLTSGFGDLGSFDNSGNLRVTGNISATAGGSVTAGSYFGASANSATTGLYNLTHADLIAFRNQLNSGDLTLGVNSSNVFTFSSSIGATNFSGSSSGSNTGDQTISLTGDVTGSGTGTFATTYAGTVPLNKGGTGQTTKAPAFDALSPMSASGDIIYGGTSGTGTRLVKGSDGQFLTLAAGIPSWAAVSVSNIDSPIDRWNMTIAATVSANALTIALKDKSGADPSASSPVKVSFRNSTLATGDYSTVSVTAALSVVAPSGATLGWANGDTRYVYVYLINNAGTGELAVSSQMWDENALQSSTTIDTASDSANVIYSTTGRSTKAIRWLGKVLLNEATAGTWATSPTEISTDWQPKSATAMDNSEATRLGFFQYLADVSGGGNDIAYNGGVKATISKSSGTGSLSSIRRAVFIPYQMQDGTWRCRFNLDSLWDSQVRTGVTIAINGITFKNTTGSLMPMAVVIDGTIGAHQGFVNPNANTITFGNGSTATTEYTASGDVELESRPTWAYG